MEKVILLLHLCLPNVDTTECFFIEEQILPQMQDYIKDNQHHYIDIFFSTEEESKSFTYDELFNPK